MDPQTAEMLLWLVIGALVGGACGFLLGIKRSHSVLSTYFEQVYKAGYRDGLRDGAIS